MQDAAVLASRKQTWDLDLWAVLDLTQKGQRGTQLSSCVHRGATRIKLVARLLGITDPTKQKHRRPLDNPSPYPDPTSPNGFWGDRAEPTIHGDKPKSPFTGSIKRHPQQEF